MNEQSSLFQQSTGGNSSAQSPFSGASKPEQELEKQLRSAQRDVSNLLILMFVIGGTFAVFLLQQVRYDRADLAGLRAQEQQLPHVQRIIASYNQDTLPVMQSFFGQLQEFSKTNPSVLPILARYGLAQPIESPAPGSSPAPGTPTAKAQ